MDEGKREWALLQFTRHQNRGHSSAAPLPSRADRIAPPPALLDLCVHGRGIEPALVGSLGVEATKDAFAPLGSKRGEQHPSCRAVAQAVVKAPGEGLLVRAL